MKTETLLILAGLAGIAYLLFKSQGASAALAQQIGASQTAQGAALQSIAKSNQGTDWAPVAVEGVKTAGSLLGGLLGGLGGGYVQQGWNDNYQAPDNAEEMSWGDLGL